MTPAPDPEQVAALIEAIDEAGPGGVVRATDIDPDYRYRPEPQKTLDDLAALA